MDRKAIVIGASMGGLLAARVLAGYFTQVTLLERDSFPAAGENRKGVPQGRHAHAVLAQGLQIMETYFPGLTDRLVSLGADYGDVSHLARWYHEGDFHQPAVSGLNAINISRLRLEAEVRARVLALPNVQVGWRQAGSTAESMAADFEGGESGSPTAQRDAARHCVAGAVGQFKKGGGRQIGRYPSACPTSYGGALNCATVLLIG